MKWTFRFSAGLILLLLVGCIPTVSKEYQAPRVIGQVIDLATLKPIAGVNVAHLQSTKNFVVTNSKGEFVLPSIAELDLKLLMAGHALKDNLVTFYNQDNQMTFIVQSTLNSQAEETINLASIVFDSDPKIIALPFKPEYLEYNQLRAYFLPNSILASCNDNLSNAATSSLNTSRKLADMARNKLNLAKGGDSQIKKLAKVSYQRTNAIWQELKSSCDRTTGNYKKIDKIVDAIQKEASEVSF